jgi:hypothetical protein
MGDEGQREDLTLCADLLLGRCHPQPLWPFSYPYGRAHSFNSVTVQILSDLGFACSFVSEVGPNDVGGDPYRIRRIDPKDVAERMLGSTPQRVAS